MPTQAPTPTSTVVTQQPSVSIAQVSHSAAQLVHNSRTGTPVSSLVRQATHSVPQGLPAQVRVQSQSPALPTSSPAPRVDFFTESPLLLRRPPLRRSLRLPSFLENNGYDGWSSNEEQTSAPVAPQDANTSPNESLPRNVTQARSRALRFFNVRLLPRQTSLSSLRIPTILELRANALREYGLGRRRNRTRQPSVNSSTRNRDRLSSAELTPSQRTVMAPAEMHVLKDVLWTNPWPEPERRAEYLLDAQRYATEITGISGDDVFIPEFLNTVWDKMSNDRGNLLSKIECMMEHEFGIAAGDKALIFKLMEKDSFLYPTLGREPSDYFCVGALGSALEIIMFKSAKVIGVVFMEELCKPDDTEKSARWHRKMHDRTACMGVPPGLLAFAATQMYWALEKLYMGTTVHFDQQHYRGVWDRYFRALIQLPHLGQLRVDMLDRLKEYYMVHWPAEEPDEDNESFPAW